MTGKHIPSEPGERPQLYQGANKGIGCLLVPLLVPLLDPYWFLIGSLIGPLIGPLPEFRGRNSGDSFFNYFVLNFGPGFCDATPRCSSNHSTKSDCPRGLPVRSCLRNMAISSSVGRDKKSFQLHPSSCLSIISLGGSRAGPK